ncbi:unnamed protein product [Rotaria sordida]|uniref:Mos1 transposase HTH domain-containing protein n=1 Tax=Rotaria sordida TaxID=392033 RepID=A0A819L7R3_9BILA|nr:unnamed protein product [Rotaria sordida]CAF3961745.1 unnamed protein product [Rotaria sordida]
MSLVRTALNIEERTIHDELRTVFGDEAPSYRTVARWAQWVREGREEIEDEERSGRSVTESTLENIEEIRSIVSDHSHVTIAELQEHTDLTSKLARDVESDGEKEDVEKEDAGDVLYLISIDPFISVDYIVYPIKHYSTHDQFLRHVSHKQ